MLEAHIAPLSPALSSPALRQHRHGFHNDSSNTALQAHHIGIGNSQLLRLHTLLLQPCGNLVAQVDVGAQL